MYRLSSVCEKTHRNISAENIGKKHALTREQVNKLSKQEHQAAEKLPWMRHPVDGGAKSDGEGKANVYSLCVGSSRSTCSNSHVTLMTLPFGEQQDEGTLCCKTIFRSILQGENYRLEITVVY